MAFGEAVLHGRGSLSIFSMSIESIFFSFPISQPLLLHSQDPEKTRGKKDSRWTIIFIPTPVRRAQLASAEILRARCYTHRILSSVGSDPPVLLHSHAAFSTVPLSGPKKNSSIQATPPQPVLCLSYSKDSSPPPDRRREAGYSRQRCSRYCLIEKHPRMR